MYEENRLVSVGWPLSDAVSLCASMRRGREDLERFVREQEAQSREGGNAVLLL